MHAQSEQAREHLDTLCAPGMHGRGYVMDGDRVAADYIRDRLMENGADPLFEKGHFQEFEVTVNRFPGELELIWGKDTLRPGHDYLVDPFSGGGEGRFKPFPVTPGMLQNQNGMRRLRKFGKGNDRVAILDPQKAEGDSLKKFLSLRFTLAQKGPVIVLGDEELTWSVQGKATDHPILEVDREKVDLKKGPVRIRVDQELVEGYSTQNVGGIIEGKDPNADTLLLSGHYDQLGRMGKETYFPGASDNGSGTAMLLYLAEQFAEDPPDRTIVFLFFGAEELGLLGSKQYVEDPAFPLEQIRFQVNLDIVGGGSEGITAVNGKVHEKELELLRSLNEKAENPFPKIKARGKAANSDHHWFSEEGVPAFFIYTLGDVEAYHDVHDTAENLPLSRFDELVKLMELFIDELE